MTILDLLSRLKENKSQFKDVLNFIEQHYEYVASAFNNGSQYNSEQENQGSARVLYFAKLNNLDADVTLTLFAEHYQSVLQTPDAEDHQNIRQFMVNGWEGVTFEKEVLKNK